MKIFLPISIDRWRSPLATLCRAIVENNTEFHFSSFSNPVSDEDVNLGNFFWNLPNVKKIASFSAAFDSSQVVHTVSLNPRNLAIALYAKARTGGRTVFLNTINLEHDSSMPKKDWLCYLTSLALVDRYCSVSEAASASVRHHAPERFARVIPNGYDHAYFDPSLNDSVDLPKRIAGLLPRSFALYVGALEPRKHPEFIVEMAKMQPEVTFIGAGYVHPQGKCFLEMMNSLPNLIWLGHCDRRMIRYLLKNAGVLLFPSEREGLPLSVIEAMGMGLPVIAQPKSSLPELIVNEDCGKLIPIDQPDSLEQWASALNQYLQMPEVQRTIFSQRLSRRTAALYAWESIGKSYGQLYRELIHH